MKQISIVSEDQCGLISELTRVLASHTINILSFDAESFQDQAVALLSVDQYEKAITVLRAETAFKILADEVILVRIDDAPGALAKIAKQISDKGLSIRSMRIIQRGTGDSIVAICADKSEALMACVKEILIS